MTCENCGRLIGNLETPSVYKEHIVCGECYERMIPVARADSGPITAPPKTRPNPSMKTCPDCGHPVSKTAPICLNCGRDPERIGSLIPDTPINILIVFVVIVIIVACVAYSQFSQ